MVSPGMIIAEDSDPIIGMVNLNTVISLALTYLRRLNHRVKATADISTSRINKMKE